MSIRIISFDFGVWRRFGLEADKMFRGDPTVKYREMLVRLLKKRTDIAAGGVRAGTKAVEIAAWLASAARFRDGRRPQAGE